MLYDPKWEQQIALEPWRAVLWRAADLVERRGLYKFGFGGDADDNFPICTHRAIDIASRELMDGDYSQARALFMRHVGTDSICNWTDTMARSQREVVTALRAAAMTCAERTNRFD